MRYLVVISLTLLVLSCDKEEVRVSCDEGIHQGQLLPISSDQSLRLVEVKDDFCPCDVVCVHAGSLSAVLAVSGAPERQIELGIGIGGALIKDTIDGYIVTLDTIYTEIPCGGAVPAEEICLGFSVEEL